MQLMLEEGLPFISMLVASPGSVATIDRVLVDSGSASTILAAQAVEAVGIEPQLDDTLYSVRGVGGVETVYARRIPRLAIGQLTLHDVEVEIGAMSYGFPIDGILGMDILTQTGAIIDLHRLTLEFAGP
ncbi:MAG: retropepsin-like aspartic protease [Anaerolineae bacterium]